jgi:hypothetical protein
MEHAYDAQPTKGRLDARIAPVAARQHGVFSRAQVMELSGTRNMVAHRIRAQRWEIAAPDVFRLGGSSPSWMQALMTACLTWGIGAVVYGCFKRQKVGPRASAPVPTAARRSVPAGRTPTPGWGAPPSPSP